MIDYRVHDLLLIAHDDIALPADAPGWVVESLHRAPWVVVRRASTPLGHIAVGVRGALREQRYALIVPRTVVKQCLTPELLAGSHIQRHGDHPAHAALSELRARLRDTPLRWGPTGSVGFELASQCRCVSAISDLDIAVFTEKLDFPALQAVADALDGLPARVDCSIELGCGAVALNELLHGTDRLLLKSADGPRLIPRSVLPT